MNRRSFIAGIIAASVAPMWLPSAGRVWRPVREVRWRINPAWLRATHYLCEIPNDGTEHTYLAVPCDPLPEGTIPSLEPGPRNNRYRLGRDDWHLELIEPYIRC